MVKAYTNKMSIFHGFVFQKMFKYEYNEKLIVILVIKADKTVILKFTTTVYG